MKFDIRPTARNTFELNGILIKGPRVKSWLLELQRMKLSWNEVEVYPLPGPTANSIYGCLVVLLRKPAGLDPGKHAWCQQVSANLFIAERTVLFPAMRQEEVLDLFGNSRWFMHPETGLAELTEAVDIRQVVRLLSGENRLVEKPEPGVFIPAEVKSFRLAPVKAEDTLKKLEEEAFPKREKLEDKPLNLFEKAKLSFYRYYFRQATGGENPGKPGFAESLKTYRPGWLDQLLDPFFGKKGKRSERMQQDFENLEERNQKQIDKLLDMLRKNPKEALRFAIPLDEGGSSRGSDRGALQLDQRWSGFSLFGGENISRSGRSGSVDIGDHFYKLQEQYRATAEQLIRENEFEKAAFVYLKLLKDTRLAAATLEKGELYQDAASVYLKHLNDKQKAAACYEKANLIENAIDLYKELNEFEKTGDMYLILKRKKEADTYFEQAAQKLKNTNRYIPASRIYFDKIQSESLGRRTLLEGWQERIDEENCLKSYFSCFQDPEELKIQVQTIRENEVKDQQVEAFLQVLKHPCFKTEAMEEFTRETAYEIISGRIVSNPGIVKELRAFNPQNKGLLKDTIRFSIGRNRRK